MNINSNGKSRFNPKVDLKIHLAILLALLAASSLPAEAPKLATFDTIQSDMIGHELQGAMIWTGAVSNKTGVAVAFRRTFDLSAVPKTAGLHIFADARYILWVNGEYVERGPNRFQPNGPEYDTVNVASRLKRGKNAMAVLVVGNLSGGKLMGHAPGLTALLEIDGNEMFHTDANWKFSDATRFREVEASWPNLGETLVDARVEDGDWTRAEYSDANWKAAFPVEGKLWGALTARRIPRLRETEVPVQFANHVKLPVKLAAGQKLEFTTDRIVQAYPVIELEAEAGTELSFEPFGVRYIAKSGSQKYFTIDTRGITGGGITVKSGEATITGFRLVERLYPFDCAGSFHCNDKFLNDLWTLCGRSLQVLSEDAYVDCADRERVEWMDNDPPGFDISRTAMVGPGADGAPRFADPRLLGEVVRRTALTLQPEGWVKAHTCSDRYDIHAKMEDRACDWVAGIRRYYEATGDAALVREVWPAVMAQMDYFLARRTPRGLVFGRDWEVWGNPVGYVTFEGAGLNAFVYRALDDAAYLAAAIDKNAQAREWEKAAQDLAAAFNQVLWDEKDGTFYSGYFDPGNPESASHKPSLTIENHFVEPTVYPAIFALYLGIVSPEHRERVLNYLIQHRDFKGRVMIYYYLHQLLYAAGPDYDREILECYRKKWKGMVESPWQCSWEEFSGGSHAHCYGMFPGYFLSAYVLGVRRDAPVAERQLIIEPHLGDLTNAEGKVVTEFGVVPVSWRRQNDELAFKFNLPENVRAVLRLPDGEANTLTLDGQKPKAEIQGRYLALPVSPGAYEGRISVKPLPPAGPAVEAKETWMPSDLKDAEIFAKITSDSAAGLEADIVKTGLVSIASTSEENVAHDGGGKDAGALFNGTTQNGSGGDETLNDGKTFRGYGAGSSLTIRLEQPSDIACIRTFAGHGDARASQNYTLFAAYASAPEKFVKLTHAAVQCDGGASALKIMPAVKNAVALRFEFENGPLGFNVYREINLLGKKTGT
jgi:hypothetical protein